MHLGENKHCIAPVQDGQSGLQTALGIIIEPLVHTSYDSVAWVSDMEMYIFIVSLSQNPAFYSLLPLWNRIPCLLPVPYHCIWEVYELPNFVCSFCSVIEDHNWLCFVENLSSETIDFEILANECIFGMNVFCLVRWMWIFGDQRWCVSKLTSIESS